MFVFSWGFRLGLGRRKFSIGVFAGIFQFCPVVAFGIVASGGLGYFSVIGRSGNVALLVSSRYAVLALNFMLGGRMAVAIRECSSPCRRAL